MIPNDITCCPETAAEALTRPCSKATYAYMGLVPGTNNGNWWGLSSDVHLTFAHELHPAGIAA
eukprot:15454015-Alexandrium_andersonii.AAC.1